jgi:hypothetical protein
LIRGQQIKSFLYGKHLVALDSEDIGKFPGSLCICQMDVLLAGNGERFFVIHMYAKIA